MKKREWNISVCGLNCATCDIFLAGHGDEKRRKEIIDWLREKRNKIVKPEQITCEGCRGSLEVHWGADCKMMCCAKRRGVTYCFQCADFPCSMLEAFASDGVDHHKRTVENLKKMKEIGMERWLQEQEKKGQCEFCP